MSLELGMWNIDGNTAKKVSTAKMESEAKLEDILAADISIASPDWMLVGRQIQTDYSGRIDLLAVDRGGKLIVLELKRDKTPRDVVGQVLDYASWVKELPQERITEIYAKYQTSINGDAKTSLDDAFLKKFNLTVLPDNYLTQHEAVVVASELDDSTERIITYLSETHGVPINAAFFRIFQDNNQQYLTRAWFRDPTIVVEDEAQTTASSWNGEFYVSLWSSFKWEVAQKYGFIAAGGGAWYSRTLWSLEEGSRVWVNLVGSGYVGVGIVTGSPVLASDFWVLDKEGNEMPLTQVDSYGRKLAENDDTDEAFYLVSVEWDKTVPKDKAIRETGFFGNQNSVCRPRTPKWNHTVSRLKTRLDIAE